MLDTTADQLRAFCSCERCEGSGSGTSYDDQGMPFAVPCTACGESGISEHKRAQLLELIRQGNFAAWHTGHTLGLRDAHYPRNTWAVNPFMLSPAQVDAMAASIAKGLRAANITLGPPEQQDNTVIRNVTITPHIAPEHIVLTCTGEAASWCPIHGDCSCPTNGQGERLSYSDKCLLHSSYSEHNRSTEAASQSAPDEATLAAVPGAYAVRTPGKPTAYYYCQHLARTGRHEWYLTERRSVGPGWEAVERCRSCGHIRTKDNVAEKS